MYSDLARTPGGDILLLRADMNIKLMKLITSSNID